MKRKVVKKFQGNAKKALLRWVQCTAAKCVTFSCPFGSVFDMIDVSSVHETLCLHSGIMGLR